MHPSEEKVLISADIAVHLRDSILKFAEAKKLTFAQAVEVLLCQAIVCDGLEKLFRSMPVPEEKRTQRVWAGRRRMGK